MCSSSAALNADRSLPHFSALCHPDARRLYRLPRLKETRAFSKSSPANSSIAASQTSTVCSQVCRDIPTGTPPSSTPPPRLSITSFISSLRFKQLLGAVSVPHLPFFIDSHTVHLAVIRPPLAIPSFLACSSNSSNRALFTFPVRSIISARQTATIRVSLNDRFTDISSVAASDARTHRLSTPTPNATMASSSCFKSLSSQGSVLPLAFLPLHPLP